MVVGDRVGNSSFFDSNTVFSTMDLWHDQFVASHAAPWLPVSLGHDYRTPTLFDASLNSLPGRDKAAFMGEWVNVSGPAVFGERTPAVEYNHVHGYLAALQQARAAILRALAPREQARAAFSSAPAAPGQAGAAISSALAAPKQARTAPSSALAAAEQAPAAISSAKVAPAR